MLNYHLLTLALVLGAIIGGGAALTKRHKENKDFEKFKASTETLSALYKKYKNNDSTGDT